MKRIVRLYTVMAPCAIGWWAALEAGLQSMLGSGESTS